ncbi:SLBB domain-containing protein [bacterium]|nr:SLBB domain-containing protein [candidate division CSSED10-310 bacterium]
MSPLTFSTILPDEGLKKAVSIKRSEILAEISASKIKGRGGAGFPTGTKWNLAAAAKDTTKFIVCNADEGEPGTFKDRIILMDHADLVFEGMTIAARAVGSKEGILYLRGEYTYLLSHLETILQKRRDNKLLGDAILGVEGFQFDIRIHMGSGAYICGEETALIESIEGNRGEPRNRPPYPVDTGLKRHPTVVNNVETFAWCACIIGNGAEWFLKHGTAVSTGLKLFSISGDVERPGVYEFPWGITVSEVLEKCGGRNAKAVQIGGASGYCIPRSQFDRKIAYEDISTGGSIIVFGPDRDMLKVAKNFLEFFVEESCGQCTPCRDGNPVILDGIERLEKGTCSITYLNELRALSETMQVASKCGLGQTSTNAFLSILEHFKDECMGRGRE